MAQTKTRKRTTRKVVKGRRRKNALHPEPPMSYWRGMAVQGREAGNTLQMVKAQAMPDLDQYAAMYRSRALGEMERGYRSSRNSFLGAIAEGAGTGIGLGLAGAAALPMVRKAFPGLMRGKANPEVVTHRSGLPIAYSDQVGRGSGTLKSGETVDYTVKGQRVSYAWTDRNGTAWKGTTSLKNFKAYTTDERTIVDKVLGRKSAHERGLWKPFPKSNPEVKPGDRVSVWAGLRMQSGIVTRIDNSYSIPLYLVTLDEGDKVAVNDVQPIANGRRSNPGPAADALYEEFHGAPPTGYEEIIDELHVHGHLAELGTLVSIKVSPQYGKGKGKTYELDFAKANVLLCSNETGTHLYFRGGNQEVSPKALGFTGHQATKDLMDLGIMQEITYQTKKGFDGFKRIDYYHQLGEVSKDTQPTLLYDTMNHELQMAGGSYVVLPAGITD